VSVPDVSPDIPTRTWRVVLAMLGRLPQGAMSRSFGRVADLPLPMALRRPVLGRFARAMGIDLTEAELPLEAYGSLNELFVRRLRAGLRSWPDDPRTVASPVDGIVGQIGRIDAGRLIQAKGRSYSAAELLMSRQDAGRYDGGSFVTLYLSPRHYHRIHAPVAGEIRSARHVPGALLPVNEPAVSHVTDLFVRNERLLCHLERPEGAVAVVAVGAYNVGRISAAFDPEWQGTNRRRAPLATRDYDPPVRVARGEEIMAFHLGSTVVLLLEPAAPALVPALRAGQEVRVGDALSG
jgi:phosphatidylserine decarboxylase